MYFYFSSVSRNKEIGSKKIPKENNNVALFVRTKPALQTDAVSLLKVSKQRYIDSYWIGSFQIPITKI